MWTDGHGQPYTRGHRVRYTQDGRQRLRRMQQSRTRRINTPFLPFGRQTFIAVFSPSQETNVFFYNNRITRK